MGMLRLKKPPFVYLDDYQSLDPAASRSRNVPTTSCEAYYQTSQSGGEVWDPRYQSCPITSWPRNHKNLSSASHYDAASNNGGVDDGDLGSGSLELMKNPFPDDDGADCNDDSLPTPPPALLKTASTKVTSAVARSRTLNFPKETFV